jgi:hypothetical protein
MGWFGPTWGEMVDGRSGSSQLRTPLILGRCCWCVLGAKPDIHCVGTRCRHSAHSRIPPQPKAAARPAGRAAAIFLFRPYT